MSTQPVEPAPGYTYTRPTAVPPAAPRSGIGALAVRMVLTLIGAAGLIIGSFLDWFRTFTGTEIGIRSYWSVPGHTGAFLRSAGFATLVLGLVAIIGLAPRSGWLTRLAGALGLVAMILFVIQMYRAPGNATVADLAMGAWLVVGGAVVALVGGFFGTRYRVTYAAPETATTTVETAP